MKIYKILFVLILLTTSCTNIFEQKEYIPIYIVNHTNETIKVYTGLHITIFSVPSAIIPVGNGQSVLAEKGESIAIHGKDTSKNYGSRSFFMETQWDVY
jgi:hypothetical protein